HGSVFAGDLAFYEIGLIVEIINSARQRVVGNIVEVTPETKPWSRHRNMIGSAFSLCLDQQFHSHQVLSVPRREWFKFLQPVGFGTNAHYDTAAVFRGCEVSCVLYREPSGGKLYACWFFQSYLHAIFVGKRIGNRVKR